MPQIIINTVGVKASGSLTFTGTDCVGFLITIGGKGLQEGVDWTADITTALDATALAAAINTNTATCLCTAVAVGSTVNITANTAGTAGNALVITVSSAGQTSQSGAHLTGGAAGAPVDGTLSTAPIRLRNLRVKSTGSALGVNVLNGGSGGTEYDLVTGVTGTTVVRNYVKGLALPAGGYVTLGADVTQVVAQFDLI